MNGDDTLDGGPTRGKTGCLGPMFSNAASQLPQVYGNAAGRSYRQTSRSFDWVKISRFQALLQLRKRAFWSSFSSLSVLESQRDSGPKPKVARHELPWVTVHQTSPTATRLRQLSRYNARATSPQPR